MNETVKPFVEAVAEKLIEQLKAGVAPWQKPWQPGESGMCLPTNPVTGNRYKGINAIHLMSQGREDQRWMTYKQAESVGAQVRKGEKGTPIQYWKFSEEQTKTDADDKPVLDADGLRVKQTVRLERPALFMATVFNAEQIDGLPPVQRRKEQEWTAIDRAEKILQATGAVIRHGEHDRAYYRPATDSIHLPGKEQFAHADQYYATALHELGHWTGHGSRLDRDLAHPFGSEGYAKEELRAEIASMIMGDELGIGHDPRQHAAYVGSWIKAIREDPLEIFRAAADAERIQTYVLGLEQKQVQAQAPVIGERVEGIDQRSARQTFATALEPVARDVPREVLDVNNLAALADQEAEMKTRARKLHPRDHSAALLAAPDAVNSDLSEGERAVVAARSNFVRSEPDAREQAGAAFEAAASLHLGFALPSDWSGRIQVQGNVRVADDDRQVVPAASRGLAPQFWSVYAQQHDGTSAWLADVGTEQAAEKLAGRLLLIDAHSQASEHEKAARLARIREDAVRRDPQSTTEDMAAAREARKDAEFNATRNDSDLQRRIAEKEQEQGAARTDAETPAGIPVQSGERHYINVPFREKDEAKALGARWDRREQAWYIPQGLDPAPFEKYARPAGADGAVVTAISAQSNTDGVSSNVAGARQYLAVPYGERMMAKAAGAEWDRSARSWYAGPGADLNKLERWKPENILAQQAPAMTPREEFSEALRLVGCIVGGEHPIMDGHKHRISVAGEKHSERSGSGFYVGHLDGYPAGYVKNNKTGLEMHWRSKGYTLDPEQKRTLQAQAASKGAERAAEQASLQEQAADRIGRQITELVPVRQATPYMQAKGIEPRPGALTDHEGKTTYLPATDADGKLWSMQYVLEDGTKRFAKDSRKTGCFHTVGGLDSLAKAPVLVIAEGYATASSLSQSLGFATVAAFDSGNLPEVALALHAKFPDKPVVIAGDDDQHLATTQGVNPGKKKAYEAAYACGGTVVLPIFAPGEQTANPKGFSDFNDLAHSSVLGEEGVRRQLRPVVEAEIARRQSHVQEQVLTQQQEQVQRRSARL